MASRIGGYVGKILRVDLSKEEITQEEVDAKTLRECVGGTGLAVKYLYEEVPPGVEWSDPENRIMFFPGPLGGTRVSGCGAFSIVSKGAMTGFGASSQANGYFGAYVKFAGFDGIVVHGRANRWVYLHVHDGTAELRDASHLVGKGTWETEDAIKEGLKRQASVFSIGPAGENLIRFAGVVGDRGHSASHNGLGAVMGSKKLKAIVAERANNPIFIADEETFSKKSKALLEAAIQADPNMGPYGTAFIYPVMLKMGILPTKNYTTNLIADAEKFSGQSLRSTFKVKPSTCWACRIGHCRIVEISDGPYAGFVGEEPEYEWLAAMGSMIGNTDPAAAIRLGNEVDNLGFDVNESGYLMGWIIECYEKGYLKKSDVDDIEMTWGNHASVLKMLRKVAHREGCGNLFAEGVRLASKKIGGEAAKCAVYSTKGASPRGHDHRGRWAEMIDTCLSNTGTVEAGPGVPRPEQFGMEPLKDPFDPIAVSTINAKINGRHIFEDSLVLCFFCTSDIQLTVDVLNAVTGWDFDIWEALNVGKRAVNRLRVFAVRHGLKKDIEVPSLRYSSVPIDGPNQGKSIMPHWEALRSNYYKEMGWDPETGRPLKETLEKYGLGPIFQDMKA
jgi:aldehyde:ferredoxin oxidoreductase